MHWKLLFINLFQEGEGGREPKFMLTPGEQSTTYGPAMDI